MTNQGVNWALLGSLLENGVEGWRPRTRKHEVVDKVIKDKFSATLLTDDDAAYKSYAARIDSVTHALCWSHSRRYIVDARTG